MVFTLLLASKGSGLTFLSKLFLNRYRELKQIYHFIDLVGALSGALVLDPGKPGAMEETDALAQNDLGDVEQV